MNHGRVYLVLLFAFVAIVGESGLMLASSAANAGDRTFGGRTFDDWKVLAVNDLDPQTRAKAMSAIGVLGHNGHRAAAIEVLQRAIASESDATVARAGYAAILSFGDDSIAAIEAGLSAEDENKRRVAITVVRNWLRTGSARSNIPGGSTINQRFRLFQRDLPRICTRFQLERSELTFNDYAHTVSCWLDENA